MQKVILKGAEAMKALKAGVDLVADPIRSTIGPKGKTVILSESLVADYAVRNYAPVVTKDGWRVSQSISSTDANVQVGCLLLQAACAKTMADCGDSTSTTALLTQAILEGGLKLIEEGGNVVEIVEGINQAVSYVVEELKKMATPINGDADKIRSVATVTSNNDAFIGNLIAEAFAKIGDDGVISLSENKGRETTITIADGIKFSRGWASPYFVTNKAKAECELINPYILLYDRPITSVKQIMPLLEQVLPSKRAILIIADDIDGEALATLTFNMQQNNMLSCAIATAFLGQRKRDFMEDLGAATGATFINELAGVKLESATLAMLGQAQKVVIGKDETVIIGGIKDEARFDKLVDSLKELEVKEEDLEEKELIKKRIARLKGCVATINVGGTTELELKERVDRVDDSIRSTRSAIEEGYLPGGGTAFMRVPLPIVTDDKLMAGYNLIFGCLEKSLEQICINAGVDVPHMVETVKKLKGNYGYNAKTDTIEDLAKAGIIEPMKSNRCALQNAASVVTQILSSQFMVTDTI